MAGMDSLAKIVRENQRLREENKKLQKEIELENKIYLQWKTVAGLFHDALWEALLKYDPERYRGKREHMFKNEE